MKATLKLNNPLWKTPERKAILSKAVQQSAVELEKEIKDNILRHPARGRTYRRGAITRSKNSKAIRGLKLRSKGEKKIVGSRFHRASRRGDPFASDTGQTINAIRARKIALLKARVAVGVKHAKVLDDPNGLNRPFFKSVAEKFKPTFKANLQKAVAENS